MLVIAGAGSGKTTTMVAKVKYLIEVEKVHPECILMISFTNKATEELIERIQKDFKLSVDILTFHKLGLMILKQYRKVQIQTEGKRIVKKIIKKKKKNWKWRFLFPFYTKKYDEKQLEEIIYEFIKKYKMKDNPNFSTFHFSRFWKSFLKEIIMEYNKIMKKNQWIDFEDMILLATDDVRNKKIEFPYQYIIVDEYQDISMDRFLLLKALKEKFSCTLIVVGDDWQSIFGFSGSELNLFTKFQDYFKESSIFKITKTYRNSQELIDIAGSFVMQNQSQIKKQLTSCKHIENPILLMSYKNKNHKQLLFLLNYISTLREKSKVFLLGRFHHDFVIENYSFLKEENGKIICSLFPNLELFFLTVHSAKGLGADEVILLNGNSGDYGFPSMKKTDEILKQFESDNSTYLYAEERRLFYVALTRTKNHVFILYQKNSPSVFVSEIKKKSLTLEVHRTKFKINFERL